MVKKLTELSVMTSFSLVFYIVESMFPDLSFIAPGVKIGLSNIVSVFLLYTFGFKEATLVLFIRTLMTSAFFGGMSAFLYSIAGGLMSILSMSTVKSILKDGVSPIGVSITGALFFNLGQIFVASVIIKNSDIFWYFPIIGIISVFTGAFIGLVAGLLVKRKEFVNILKR